LGIVGRHVRTDSPFQHHPRTHGALWIGCELRWEFWDFEDLDFLVGNGSGSEFNESFLSNASIRAENLSLSLFPLKQGSMPTDGTIFLENIPARSQFLLTGLSVFFSIGAVISSILGLLIIPSASCPEQPPNTATLETLEAVPCDVETENDGWRWMLRILGGLVRFLFRLFPLPFLVASSPLFLSLSLVDLQSPLVCTHRPSSCS